jgi:DNA polymerase alpha subunit B
VTLDGFSITQLLQFPSLSKALSPIQDLVSSPVISIIVASGPYNDYLDVCLSQASAQTHALILLGPFIDPENEKQFVTADLPSGGSEALFLDYFLPKINSIVEKYPLLKVVLVPSTRDTFHDDFTLPQSSFPFSAPNPNIIMMPNPAVFAVNDIIIATTSADILFDMSAFEISRQKISEAPSDRMSRLCKHLLDQRHFYPLLPASPTSPMKNGFCTEGMKISIAPDIMILPSQHKYFVKNVDDVLCVNPGKAGRGTIARIVVHPLRGTAVEMAKGDPGRLVPHFVDGRCRVDILSVAQ